MLKHSKLMLTLLLPDWPKLHRVLAILEAIGLTSVFKISLKANFFLSQIGSLYVYILVSM